MALIERMLFTVLQKSTLVLGSISLFVDHDMFETTTLFVKEGHFTSTDLLLKFGPNPSRYLPAVLATSAKLQQSLKSLKFADLKQW